MNQPIKVDEPLTDVVFNYKTLRYFIGLIAFAIPWVCAAAVYVAQDFNWIWATSISVSYHLGAGDVFVAMLAVVGAFLLAYNGHKFPFVTLFGNQYPVEKPMALVAGVCAFGIALFPTSVDKQWIDALLQNGYVLADFPTLNIDDLVEASLATCNQDAQPTCILSAWQFAPAMHMACAVVLFFVLIGFCINFIRRTSRKLASLSTEKDSAENDEKSAKAIAMIKWRRRLYYVSAGLMICSAVLALGCYLAGEPFKNYIVMVVEVGCLAGFGLSWFVSGAGILRGNDKTEQAITNAIDIE